MQLKWFDEDGNKITTGIAYSSKLMSDGKRSNSMLKWTFKADRKHNGKRYTCQADSPAQNGPSKASVFVEVKYPPEVQITVDKPEYREGDDMVLKCKVDANPSDSLVYKWYKNGELLLDDISTTLRLTRLSRGLNGIVVTCMVSNSVGSAQASHEIAVLYGPMFRSVPEPVNSALPGGTVRLSCDVDGNPKPDIVWYFNGSLESFNGDEAEGMYRRSDLVSDYTNSGLGRVVGKESNLVLRSMDERKVGRYTCIVSSKAFASISASTHVFLKGMND